PDGSMWARQARSFAREVEEASHGQLRVKWYFSGADGDERAQLRYLRERKLDGMASAVCGSLAPALKVTSVVGLFQARDEGTYILRKLRPLIDKQMRDNGVTDLGLGGFGEAVLFSRTPVRSLAEMQRGTYFFWDMHPVGVEQLTLMGVHVKALSVADAGRAYDAGTIDGFVMSPTAALAFQWSTQTKYFNDLQLDFTPACLVVSNATMDALPIEQQRILHVAGERLATLFSQAGELQENELIHHLFEHQGLQRITVDASFRDEFYSAARKARAALPPDAVPADALRTVLDLLADYRAELRFRGSVP
ncbi:MAG TPA: TRAP transporter substrate-binding protein DctP, partial [Polyangia bacterium]|nr:TRAP transporter substrate-binding protein DctP [Polyangia bacterium]